MTVELCRGRPPEWWEPQDPGARLGLAICRRCPALQGCLDGDPKPRGVIRAGVAWTDDGYPFHECPTCGYPQTSVSPTALDRCPRCDLPPVSRWRTDIERWHADGVPDDVAAKRIGVTTRQLRRARCRVVVEPDDGGPRDATGGLVDEVVVERALAGERVHLNDAETVAALQAGTARGHGLAGLSQRLGTNHIAAKRLLRGEKAPFRARREGIAAALRADPGRSDASIGAEFGRSAETVRRIRLGLDGNGRRRVAS